MLHQGSRTSKSSSLDTMMDAPAASASSRYLLSFMSRQSVTWSAGSNIRAAAPRISRMRPRVASVIYLWNFARCRTSRISVSTARERQMVSCVRARSNARSGIESALSAAPTIELASKTTFGIIDGEFRLDLLVGQPVGTCRTFDRGENRSQGIVTRRWRAQHAADELSDTFTPLQVAKRFGSLRRDRDFDHHGISHLAPQLCFFGSHMWR